MKSNKDVMQQLGALRETHLEYIMTTIDRVVRHGSPEGTSLVEMCRYHLSTGGKRLRALLPLLVAKTFGVEPSRIVPFGAACELLHNATLVHDDLQDGDRLRRGEPAVWVKYGAARAINLGDAMLYFTLMLIDELDFPQGRVAPLRSRLLRETVRVIDGQEREFLLQDDERPTVDDYFRMVEGKTSGLFALPIAGAASLCDADDGLVDALAEAAGHLGVLFQIQDDFLDLYGDKGRSRRGSDIAEGKISCLVVHCLDSAPAADAARLREILARGRDEVGDADIEDVLAMFEECGSKRFAIEEMARRQEMAVAAEPLQNHAELRSLIRGISDVFLAPIDDLIR